MCQGGSPSVRGDARYALLPGPPRHTRQRPGRPGHLGLGRHDRDRHHLVLRARRRDPDEHAVERPAGELGLVEQHRHRLHEVSIGQGRGQRRRVDRFHAVRVDDPDRDAFPQQELVGLQRLVERYAGCDHHRARFTSATIRRPRALSAIWKRSAMRGAFCRRRAKWR